MRHAPERRLDAEHAAKARRHADRSAAVVAERDRPDAGGKRRRAAAARSAGGARQVPRIACRALEAAVGEPAPAEFRQRGLAEDCCAGLAQPRHDRRIRRSRRVGRGQRAVAGGKPRNVDIVLDGDRRAVERAPWRARAPACLGPVGGCKRAVAVDDLERVEMRFELRDPIEMMLGHRDRRERSCCVALAEPGKREKADVVGHVGAARRVKHERAPPAPCGLRWGSVRRAAARDPVPGRAPSARKTPRR